MSDAPKYAGLWPSEQDAIREWSAMKARAEIAEAQAAASVKHHDEHHGSCSAWAPAQSDAILARLRALEDALTAIKNDGAMHYPPHSGEWRDVALRQRQVAVRALEGGEGG